MSNTKLSAKTAIQLWMRSAGNCQYRGCPEYLYRDDLTEKAMINGYLAHIIADSPDGPRGDPIQSPQLAKDITNLMLLCPKHHKLIDVDDIDGHSVEVLRQMKQEHEDFVERFKQGILHSHATGVIQLFAPVGETKVTELSDPLIREAIGINRYPKSEYGSIFLMNDRDFSNTSSEFWIANYREISVRLEQRLSVMRPQHLSVFAFAPIPLLVGLGRALGDARDIDLYQRNQDGKWTWSDAANRALQFIVSKPYVAPENREAVLKVEISSIIDNDGIHKTIMQELPVFSLSVTSPQLHIVSSDATVKEFHAKLLFLLNDLTQEYPNLERLHVFLSAPASICVAFGRVHRQHFPKQSLYHKQQGHHVFAMEL